MKRSLTFHWDIDNSFLWCSEWCAFPRFSPGDFWYEILALYCSIFFILFRAAFIVFEFNWFCIVEFAFEICFVYSCVNVFFVVGLIRRVHCRWCLELSIFNLQDSCSCFCNPSLHESKWHNLRLSYCSFS